MKIEVNERYGTTPNDLLNDPNISFKAKGIYGYIQSKPDKRDFSIERICKQSKDGKDSVRSALQELEKAGYLKRKPAKNENGKREGYDYILSSKPMSENPTTDNPTTENQDTISKKESSKKDIVKKKEELSKDNSEAEYGKPEINEILKKIQEACSKNNIAYDNEKERLFAKHLLTANQYGEFCEKLGKSRCQVAVDVLNASVQINFWKGFASGPKKIYQRYSDIYNERLKAGKKQIANKGVVSISSEHVL